MFFDQSVLKEKPIDSPCAVKGVKTSSDNIFKFDQFTYSKDELESLRTNSSVNVYDAFQ